MHFRQHPCRRSIRGWNRPGPAAAKPSRTQPAAIAKDHKACLMLSALIAGDSQTCRSTPSLKTCTSVTISALGHKPVKAPECGNLQLLTPAFVAS